MTAAGSATLTELSLALSLVTALTKLEATEVLVDVVPNTADTGCSTGTEPAWCTRTFISTPHETAAYDLANVLKLVPRPNLADVAGWEGIYPLSQSAQRPLCVQLALTEEIGPVIALGEIVGFLEVVTAVVPDSIPVTRVLVRADGGEVEIHTPDPDAAQPLLDELAALNLSTRLVSPHKGLEP